MSSDTPPRGLRLLFLLLSAVAQTIARTLPQRPLSHPVIEVVAESQRVLSVLQDSAVRSPQPAVLRSLELLQTSAFDCASGDEAGGSAAVRCVQALLALALVYRHAD